MSFSPESSDPINDESIITDAKTGVFTMPPKTHGKVKSKYPVVITRGLKKEETMPTDSCQFFYECTNCRKILKPKYGNCCVFCSYGIVKCPPVQKSGKYTF